MTLVMYQEIQAKESCVGGSRMSPLNYVVTIANNNVEVGQGLVFQISMEIEDWVDKIL